MYGTRLATRILAAALVLTSITAASCAGDGKSEAKAPSSSTAEATATPTPTSQATAASEPTGRIAFAAGGAIFAVNADGTGLDEIVPGSRSSGAIWSTGGGGIAGFSREGWNSSPAFSPDGSRLAFVRDYDVWISGPGGEDPHLLAEVSSLSPSAGASNNSTGGSSVVWSPDGTRLAVVSSRILGSGITRVLVVDAYTGDERELLLESAFLIAGWASQSEVTAAIEWGRQITVLQMDSGGKRLLSLRADVNQPALLTHLGRDRWLVGAFISEAPIFATDGNSSRQIATGVSPAISPDGTWVAYFDGDNLRLVALDGQGDRRLLNTAPLGGRDYHFAATPACFPNKQPGCSYRPPLISWTR